MREDTKLAQIRHAMSSGDWDKALKVASRFQRLGQQGVAIKRAADAIKNPSIYKELGYDIERLRADGIAALKERYSKSWREVQDRGTELKKS